MTPSGVCLWQISCSNKTIFSLAVTLRSSAFRGNRRTNVKWKLKLSRLTIYFLVLSLDFALCLSQRNEGKITVGSVFAIKHEIITVIGSVRGVPFKKEIMYQVNPHLRRSGDKGAQLESQQVWAVFLLSLKCGGEEEFIKLRRNSDSNSL